MELLKYIPWFTQGGAVAVLAWVFYLVVTGRLRPERLIQEIRVDRDARITEAREQAGIWKQAYETEHAARMEQESAIRETLEVTRTVEHLVRALREVATGSESKT